MARASSGGTAACTPGERGRSVGREHLETFLAEARGGGGGDGVPLSSARPGGCPARVRGVRVRRGSSETRRCDTWLLWQFAPFHLCYPEENTDALDSESPFAERRNGQNLCSSGVRNLRPLAGGYSVRCQQHRRSGA